ncbi:MAG: hypothetical protein AB7G11_12075 [Phycisphaerales bacterium]
MNDPLHNRLDRLGEQFRAPRACTPSPDASPANDPARRAFLDAVSRAHAVRSRPYRRVALFIGAGLSIAACIAVAVSMRASMLEPRRVTAPDRPVAAASPVAVNILATKSFLDGNADDLMVDTRAANPRTTQRVYAASFAAPGQLEQLLGR